MASSASIQLIYKEVKNSHTTTAVTQTQLASIIFGIILFLRVQFTLNVPGINTQP